jgi:uncharacterized protein YkwD
MFTGMKSIFVKIILACTLLFAGLTAFLPVDTSNPVQDVLRQTNAFRKEKGLAVLELREELNIIARQHSENMAKGNVPFGHTGFENRNRMAIKSMGMLRIFSENVAFGQPNGKDAVEKWKTSAGHRQNLLGKFRFTGIGTAKDKQGRIYYTQVFGG